jgi:hypothetical protein
VFYDDREHQGGTARWFAFLAAAPHHVRGHTILAAQKRGDACPEGFCEARVETIGPALIDLDRLLRKRHGVKRDIWFASARASTPHFHVHLFPRWPREESRWRKVTGYKEGHVLEFIGSLEKRGDFLALDKKGRKGVELKEVARPRHEKQTIPGGAEGTP